MGRNSCCVKEKLRKGLWSPEEDEKLHNYIARFGVGCWSSVPKLAGLQRCGKSCRLRWINYLRPDLKRGMFSQQEEDLILSLHQALGNRWAQIAAQLPGRTDNEIKNFWNSSIKKKLVKQGIDPNTHNPVNETEAKDDRRDDAALHTSQPKALPIYLTTPSEVKPTAYNFAGKQVHNYDDPTPFLPGFQASLDPEYYYYYHPESNFICEDLARSDYLHSPMAGSFDNFACGFNSMPALTHFDAANEGPSSTFCWDGQNKLDFSNYEEVTGANMDAGILQQM